jgi:hypothetical protein
MIDKHLSFAERIKALNDAARSLKQVANVILDEVACMEAAEERFAQRRSRNAKASR